MTPFGTQRAPSATVVMPFYGTAAVAFLVLSVMMVISSGAFTGHFFQPRLLAITHLATLGWGTMIIFGASHQLLPVVMEVYLYSEKLAGWCYVFLLPGVVLLVTAFWTFNSGWVMETGAILILIAVILYVINTYGTARKNTKWSISADCMVTASIWLLLTAVLGVLLVFNLRYAFLPQDHLYYLKIHAHLGMAGWFLLLVMGVASRLLPMFLLAHVEPGRWVKAAYYLVNGGLLGFLVTSLIFNQLRIWPVFALLVLAGICAYGWFVRKAWKSAMRKKTDKPMTLSLIAIALMGLPFILLGFLAFLPVNAPETIAFSLAYGMSVLGGFVTAIILGQTFKTLPFIVWMHRYRTRVGKEKTPLPRELYRETWVKYQSYAYLIGYPLLLVGALTRIRGLLLLGCLGLLATAICYNVNVFFVLGHRPKKLAHAE